jgi:hypothetical protein
VEVDVSGKHSYHNTATITAVKSFLLQIPDLMTAASLNAAGNLMRLGADFCGISAVLDSFNQEHFTLSP